jgi:hypothetical protein
MYTATNKMTLKYSMTQKQIFPQTSMSNNGETGGGSGEYQRGANSNTTFRPETKQPLWENYLIRIDPRQR